jgi:ABC-type Zn uptake system ZnuABC Zn-binding protein ZnuA
MSLPRLFSLLTLALLLLSGAACRATSTAPAGGELAQPTALSLPALTPAALDGRPLNVVATTSIIGDVVGQIGGDAIVLTTLMRANEDPHSYEATPGDLVALEQADVVFFNGWDLEERLAADLARSYGEKSVPISAEIAPRLLQDDDHDHDHGSIDPHVWLAIPNVAQWASNAATTLTMLDPASSSIFEANLARYSAELDALTSEVDLLLASLPTENRKLVTNHDSLGYFADAYGFEVVGTVIPSISASAEPSAGDLAALVEQMEQEGVCTLFAESQANQSLAETVSAELDGCDTVQLLSIYTGALGTGPASTYIGMMRTNVQTIVNGLR